MDTVFPRPSEVEVQYAFLRERAARQWTTFPYYRLVTAYGELDQTHLEIEEIKKRFAAPVDLRGFVKFENQRQKLGAYGGEEIRSVALWVAVPILLDLGLLVMDPDTYRVTETKVKDGDRFWWANVEYEVVRWEWPFSGVWANTDIPLFYEVHGDRYRTDPNVTSAWPK